MSRGPFLVLPVLVAFAIACGGGAEDASPQRTASPPSQNGAPSSDVTPGPRPPEVPGAAAEVRQDVNLGEIVREANQPPQAIDGRELNAAACEDGVMALTTSVEAIYALLPCDRFWDDDTAGFFVGQTAAITLEIGSDRKRILIETVEGAQAEFTVEGIWVE